MNARSDNNYFEILLDEAARRWGDEQAEKFGPAIFAIAEAMFKVEDYNLKPENEPATRLLDILKEA